MIEQTSKNERQSFSKIQQIIGQSEKQIMIYCTAITDQPSFIQMDDSSPIETKFLIHIFISIKIILIRAAIRSVQEWLQKRFKQEPYTKTFSIMIKICDQTIGFEFLTDTVERISKDRNINLNVSPIKRIMSELMKFKPKMWMILKSLK